MEATAETRRAPLLEECESHGHDYGVVLTFTGEPASLLCHRCGQHWRVEPA